MPAKSASQAPISRRSARIAGQPAIPAALYRNDNGESTSKAKDSKATGSSSKKRPAESTATNGDAKKTKAQASSKKAAASTSKANGNGNGNGVKSAAQKEKEAEAPASAQPTTGARGRLKEGDKLPKITLKDNKGTEVDVSTLAGEKGVVIFLYPKADTPGCTTQACGYRDHYDEITEFGYDIYGLSKDKPEAQQKWVTKKDLNYKLLCDPESKLIKRLGAFVEPNK